MKLNRVMFLGGPWDGKMLRVEPRCMDYFVCESNPIHFDMNFKPQSPFETNFIKHRYRRTTSRTFLHESEL